MPVKENAKIVSQKLWDENENLIENVLYTYDEYGNSSCQSSFNELHEPILSKDGYHKIDLSSNTFFDLNGEEIAADRIVKNKEK